MVFHRLTHLLRLWEILICFWSQYLIRFRLTTIKSVAFFYLLDWRISGATRGVRILKVSYMTSITVSLGGPLSAVSVRRFLSWLRCLLWVNCGPFIIYIMFSFFRSFPSPPPKKKRFVVFEDSEKRIYLLNCIVLEDYDACSSRLRLFRE